MLSPSMILIAVPLPMRVTRGLFVVITGDIHRQSHIQRHADIRLNGVGRGSCSPQSDLLLHGGDRDNIHFIGPDRLERLDHHVEPQPIVQGLAHDAVAKMLGGAIHGHRIAKLHGCRTVSAGSPISTKKSSTLSGLASPCIR